VLPKAVSDDVVCTPGARPQELPLKVASHSARCTQERAAASQGCVLTVVLPRVEARGMRVRNRQLLGLAAYQRL